MEFRGNCCKDLEILWRSGTDFLEVASGAFVGVRSHREVRFENAGDRPFDVSEGGINRILCYRHLNPLVVLQ